MSSSCNCRGLGQRQCVPYVCCWFVQKQGYNSHWTQQSSRCSQSTFTGWLAIPVDTIWVTKIDSNGMKPTWFRSNQCDGLMFLVLFGFVFLPDWTNFAPWYPSIMFWHILWFQAEPKPKKTSWPHNLLQQWSQVIIPHNANKMSQLEWSGVAYMSISPT